MYPYIVRSRDCSNLQSRLFAISNQIPEIPRKVCQPRADIIHGLGTSTHTKYGFYRRRHTRMMGHAYKSVSCCRSAPGVVELSCGKSVQMELWRCQRASQVNSKIFAYLALRLMVESVSQLRRAITVTGPKVATYKAQCVARHKKTDPNNWNIKIVTYL